MKPNEIVQIELTGTEKLDALYHFMAKGKDVKAFPGLENS